jgi:chloride channel protein, CIC family
MPSPSGEAVPRPGDESRPVRGSGVGRKPPHVFYRSLREFLRQLPGQAQRFWVLVFATGAVAGLGAVLLFTLLRLVEQRAWPLAGSFLSSVQSASPLRRVLVPTLAGLLISAVSLLARWPVGGHGTSGILEAVWLRRGRLALGRALARGALSIVAVGMGAPLGREGALLQTGAAAGSWLARHFGLTASQARLLVACGTAAGIAAAYNVPIGGALFGLEVILGSFALDLLGPIVVSCVVATIVSRTLVSAQPSYMIPQYLLLQPTQVLLGLGLAPLLGVASALYVRVLGWAEVRLHLLPAWAMAVAGPVALALVGAAAIQFPQLLGNGYDTVNASLLGGMPLALLLALPLLKLAATALCAGAGVPGGLFTPSLFYGALIGGAFGSLVDRIWPAAGSPGAFALIGMAGVLAGTTHAAVSAVLIIFEMTGDYGVILPLMLSAALAAATSRALERDSLYTAPLRRRGVRLPAMPRPNWLRSTQVTTLMSPDAECVSPTTPFPVLLSRLLALPRGHDLYVCTSDRELLGAVVMDDLKGTISEAANLSMIVAADVMDRRPPAITASMSLAEVAARFANTDLDRLPVVDHQNRLLGTISIRAILRSGTF